MTLRVRQALVLLVILSPTAARATRSPSFLVWGLVPFGIQADYVAAGDFNGDQFSDLAVLNGSILEVLLADGNGNLQAPTHHPTSMGVGVGMGLGDFDADGRVDVAVAHANGGISILRGGDGFSPPTPIVTRGSLAAIAVADVDGDRDLDLVVALAGNPGSVEAFVNEQGRFRGTGSLVSAGPLPFRMTAGDFDGDGNADVAVTNGGSRTVTILFGAGDGRFLHTVVLPAPHPREGGPSALLALHKGSESDRLLVANTLADIAFMPVATVSLFRASASRVFSAPFTVPVETGPRDFALGDFDGDDDPEVVAPGLEGVSVLYETGTDKLLVRPLQVRSTGTGVTVGDFNGDDRADFAVVGATPFLSVFLGQGGGRFPNSISIEAPPQAQRSLRPIGPVAGDFNGDGLVDLLAVASGEKTATLFAGRGDGVFGEPMLCPLPLSPAHIEAADLDLDGRSDLVAADTDGRLFVTFADEAECFSKWRLVSAGRGYRALSVLSLDDNPGLDLAAVFAGASSSGAHVFLNDGNGHLDLVTTLRGKKTTRVLGSDLNSDGLTDLVLLNEELGAGQSTFLGRGDGRFGPELVSPSPLLSGVQGGTVADFSGDTIPDLALSQSIDARDELGTFWLRGDGTGRFTDPVKVAPEFDGPGARTVFVGPLASADFNDDSHPDLAIASSFGGLTILTANGTGALLKVSPSVPISVGAGFAIVDLNGDGLLDIAWSWINGNGNRLTTELIFNDTPPDPIVAGDADCDSALTVDDVAVLIRTLFSPLYRPACKGSDANNDSVKSIADLARTLVLMVERDD